jgi:hypothetical protein
MTDTAYFGYLSLAIAVVSILVSVYFYVRALRLQKQIAVSQGAFRSSRISIRVFGDVGGDNYMLAVPLSRAKALLLPFNYMISNTGDSSAEDVEVFVRMSKYFHPSGRPRLRQVAGIKTSKCGLLSETEGTLTFGFSIPILHSGEGVAVTDELLLSDETIRERDVHATTADGVNVTVKTWAEFAFVIDFTIMQKHSRPITRSISLTVIDNSNKTAQERIEEYNAILRQSVRRAADGQSLLRRMFRWRKGSVIKDFKVLEFAGDLRPYKGRRDLLQLTGAFHQWNGVRFEDQLWVPGLELADTHPKDDVPPSANKNT